MQPKSLILWNYYFFTLWLSPSAIGGYAVFKPLLVEKMYTFEVNDDLYDSKLGINLEPYDIPFCHSSFYF